jgi:hypothetical protein
MRRQSSLAWRERAAKLGCDELKLGRTIAHESLRGPAERPDFGGERRSLRAAPPTPTWGSDGHVRRELHLGAARKVRRQRSPVAPLGRDAKSKIVRLDDSGDLRALLDAFRGGGNRSSCGHMLFACGWAIARSSRAPYTGVAPDDIDPVDDQVERADNELFTRLEQLLAKHEPPDLSWNFRRHMNNDSGILLMSSSRKRRASSPPFSKFSSGWPRTVRDRTASSIFTTTKTRGCPTNPRGGSTTATLSEFGACSLARSKSSTIRFCRRSCRVSTRPSTDEQLPRPRGPQLTA